MSWTSVSILSSLFSRLHFFCFASTKLLLLHRINPQTDAKE